MFEIGKMPYLFKYRGKWYCRRLAASGKGYEYLHNDGKLRKRTVIDGKPTGCFDSHESAELAAVRYYDETTISKKE